MGMTIRLTTWHHMTEACETSCKQVARDTRPFSAVPYLSYPLPHHSPRLLSASRLSSHALVSQCMILTFHEAICARTITAFFDSSYQSSAIPYYRTILDCLGSSTFLTLRNYPLPSSSYSLLARYYPRLGCFQHPAIAGHCATFPVPLVAPYHTENYRDNTLMICS
jgi:hypothetical protein